MKVASFKVGEKVVYPAHGVGVIEGIQTKVVSGSERKFYMLRILDSDMTIMIPTENVNAVGLRRIIGKDMVAKVYRILRDKKVEIDQQTWNRRYREYTEKIKTGSVLEIAKVLRDLFVLKGDKELSFGERKMLDTARNLLVKELAIANGESFVFQGTDVFMPVQYLAGFEAAGQIGDPSMYQMIPVEQWLRRYVFVTGIGYNPNYVQVVRPAGAPDVLVDGAVVGGYYAVGDYEVSDWKIGEGTHLAESEAPFGIYQVGYTAVTSYAYPGGLRLKVINPQ